MEERRLNWLQIVVTALITGVVTVGTGMLLFSFQQREPRLTFSSAETIPFAGSERIVGIYNLKLKNEGKREVSDVVCVIRVPAANIEQSKIYINPANTHSEETKGDVFTLHLSGLNPSEEVSISVLASSTQNLTNKPEVALRAAGVTGVEASSANQKTDSPLWFAIISVLIGVLSSVSLIAPLTKKLRSSIIPGFVSDSRHSADQRYVLAYLCSLSKLKEEEDYYRNLVQEAQYWSESDRLSDKALQSNDKEFAGRVANLLTRLLDYAQINDDSQAIINYNLARIAATLSDAKRGEYPATARKLAPKLIERRLHIDPESKQLIEGTT
jgi:hypothetical protein